MDTQQITLIATIFGIVALSSAAHRKVRKTKLSWFVYSGGATIVCALFPFIQQAHFASRWGLSWVLDSYSYSIEPNFFLGPVGLLVALALANRFLPNFGSSEMVDLFQVWAIQTILYWIFCVVLFYIPFAIYFYGIILGIISPMGLVVLLIASQPDPFRYESSSRSPYRRW
ncbi:hypothetical protein HRE53_30550 (plasmid) [Acaryochloris sp. 'Moss Beach']|uniref:hypothetical protein n=1 Tax=Acaryochloris sp. 'Moss Beach' TaxID=2740837 RepID=UPI001F442C1A|nr:hypothetical protein [Acaryochloris sp. 'Moss Beach']UJB72931.1 hypothetical protein HRE53_30550 [Acaryochloris sp. 'Moss Beach']